ncbi:MAG: chorismate mutase [Deltaproteobacteria bacterium RBG_13_52_11b]|nr:MAG: chorismate mutase [Deltaproteobacteria bacterium RBG_13_52_11b]
MEREECLKTLREEIEAVDSQILQLLNERAEIVLDVGSVKREANMDFYDPQREREILYRLGLKNSGLFPQQAVSSVFREIISACRSLETELAAAYFGPPGTHTHLACLHHFGNSINAQPKEGIEDVFEAVERERANYGVVPVENSTEGSVDRTLDMFIDWDVKICAEVYLRISHEFLSRNGRSDTVRKIYSHPQALGQCRHWVRKNFPHAQLIETGSTSKAAEMAAGEEDAAAIASSFAGHLYGLKVIASHIEDSLHNVTRFFVLGKQANERTGRDKTSLVFSISHTPGSLYEILKIFSEREINLTKIESRPMRGKPWEYVFFVDFDGHATDDPIDEAVSELKKTVLLMKLLGSYPKVSFEAAES